MATRDTRPHRSSTRSALLFLAGGVVTLGATAAVLLDSSRQQTTDPGSQNAPTDGELPAVPGTAPPLSWTKASVALAGAADPYNPGLEQLTIARNQNQKLDPSSTAGLLYNGIRTVIGLVPVVGQIISLGMALFEWLGPRIVGPSSGGWNALPMLARQRAVLYQLTPDFYGQPRPFPSQQIDLSAPADKPARPFGVYVPDEIYAQQYRAWLRRFLQTRMYEAEFFRVTRTTDEVMLPALVMNLLFQEGLWPPPLEPMPPRLADYQARFSTGQNPAARYYFDDGVIDHDNPLTREVYEQLVREYQDDAQRFGARLAQLEMPAELRELADNAGCVPRWGSAANPKRVESARGTY